MIYYEINNEKDAMIEYKEWHDAHKQSKFHGTGNLGVRAQDFLAKLITDNAFKEKYSLRNYTFKCYVSRNINGEIIKIQNLNNLIR